MHLDLCHVFTFVDDAHAAEAALSRLGLVESFRRRHPGQGTANLCACFDNAYLELLWPEDEAELGTVQIVRTRLAERARWRDTGACPFGIALRGRMPVPFWEYRPPYLAAGQGIAVALASEDPRQPFLFRSPGNARPDAWENAVPRQEGLAEITGLALEMSAAPSFAMRSLAERGFLALSTSVAYGMQLTISRRDGGGPRRLSLPDLEWVD